MKVLKKNYRARLARLLANGKPFKCTGTVPEMQKLIDALPPALTFVDYDAKDEVTLTYYPCKKATA
jgi:hypothetical protein